MKKLLALFAVVVFTVASCTNQTTNEEDYENGIQLANKETLRRPGNQGSSNSSN